MKTFCRHGTPTHSIVIHREINFEALLEITSTGGLPFGLTVEDLKRDHSSKPRNPLLAEVFFRRGLIERWGRGTQKIVDLCVRAGHPEPEFEERAGEVVVRFLPSGYVPPLQVSYDLSERQRPCAAYSQRSEEMEVWRHFKPVHATATRSNFA